LRHALRLCALGLLLGIGLYAGYMLFAILG
jgi:hypothetical protein